MLMLRLSMLCLWELFHVRPCVPWVCPILLIFEHSFLFRCFEIIWAHRVFSLLCPYNQPFPRRIQLPFILKWHLETKVCGTTFKFLTCGTSWFSNNLDLCLTNHFSRLEACHSPRYWSWKALLVLGKRGKTCKNITFQHSHPHPLFMFVMLTRAGSYITQVK